MSVNLLKVTIISPTPGQEFTDQPITVTGTVSLEGTSVTLNSIAATVTGTEFTATNVPLLSGTQELIAYATHNGTTAQSPSVPVTLAPLTVAITSPTEGQEFTAQPITVSGTVSRSAATVTVNGVSAAVNAAAHTFTAENVPLTPGANTLTAQATGGTETISHSVNVTLSNLTVSITSPADNEELAGEPVTVRGVVNLEGTQVTVNGIAATVAGTEFVADSIPLPSNPCVLKAVAVKGTLTAETQITVRISPLTVAITSPADGAVVTDQPITVSGTVSRSTATVTVNGVTAVVAQGRFAAEQVPLTFGANTLIATAQDQGETASASVGVSLAGVDVQPVQVTASSLQEDPQDLKVSGTLSVTVVNNGTGDVGRPYRVLVFEDRNASGAYEQGEDNFLGETSIDSGPPAGGSFDQPVSFSGEVLFRGSPLQVLVDSANDLDETNEANNLSSTLVSGYDLTASYLRLDDAGCPSAVTLTARIGNRGDLEIAPGVSVAFYHGDPASGGTLIGTALTTQTLASGHYEDVNLPWSNPTAGVESIFVLADDDGQGNGTLSEFDEANNLASTDLAVCTGPPAQGPNSLSGTVVNAVTGNPMSAVVVSLHVDNNGAPGALINHYTTGENGWFVFSGLTPGSYLLTASLAGFVSATRAVALASGDILTHQDLVLSPVLSGDDIRIVLTWDAQPEDLEAHLTAPNSEGCRLHLYYWECSIPGATLDTDAREGYGPETVTITERTAGTYRFYVHDFSNRNLIPSQGLCQSQAEVKVYVGDQPEPQVFTVPAAAGTVWHVFDLDGATGQIVPINKMTHQTDPVKVDFPRITSSSLTSVSAGESYRYQVEAEDPDLDTLEYVLQTHPEGMSIDAASGLIEWTPGLEQGGSHQVVVRVEDGRCGTASQEFRVSAYFRPIVSFTVEPCSGSNPGGTITFSWSTQRAETCVIDQGIGPVPPSGTLTIPSPAAPVVYTLTASNPAGDTSQSVPGKPEVVSFPTGPSRILFGESFRLSWSTSCAAYCRLNGEEVEPNGSITVTAEDDKSYSLTAVNAGGVDFGGTAVILVEHLRATPTCGWHAGEEVTLTWGVPSWVTHCEITPGIGVVASTGTRVVTQTAATTYTLSAEGPDGRTITEEVSVPPDPAISYFNSSRNTVEVGEEITLGWLTSCADIVTIDQGIGEVGAHGSLTLTPSQLPIMYTLTAANEKGSDSKTVLIEQESPPRPPVPSVAFSAAPSVLKHVGESAVLTWSTENATSCTLDQGIGAVGLNGSISITPDRPTTYRLTAVGPGGETSRTATITFLLPTASITADEFFIVAGENTTLRWVVGNADSAVVTPGIGAVSPEGSAIVSPGSTTTYVITATGPGGTATASVTVRVLNLFIYSPSDNETVLEQPIRVIGHVTEPLAAVTVNGIAAAVSSSGDFEVPDIPLTLGPNVITAHAQRSGKSVSKSITVSYEPLSVAITSPTNGAVVHAPLITVLGTVNSAGAQVTVNGVSAWVDVNGTFRAEGISLIEGENTIVATAQHLDLTATAQITVTLSSVQTCVVPGEYATIQAALNASQPNQTIVVCPGTYRETLSFPGHSITLVGRDGPEATIIEGNLSQPVVSIWGQGNNHTLRGFTVTNGRTGVFCEGAMTVVVEDCIITGNITTSNGGGIYSDGYTGSPSLILRRCTISENQAASGAGVYLISWVSATFDRCTIARNHATSEGAGIFHNNASCTLTNSLIWGNRAEFIGGAMNLTGGQCAITNCTIARNTSDYWCNGAFISYSCAPVVTNTILWDDSGIENPSALTYSDTMNNYPGTGNLSADPLFIAPESGNFHLQAGSPCIDTGSVANAPAKDIDGESRPFGNGVDIGADEVSSGLTVEITAPANGALIEASPITVSGSISDPAATVTVNGVNATVSGLGFTATGIALTAGENTLTAVATKGSDTTAHRIIINYQPAVLPLAVEITSPQDGTIVTTPTITVAGTVSDDTAAVTVNGVSATITNGTFTASGIVLTEGSNTITATASRGADTVTDSIIITYQAPVTPLAVEITSPQDGATVTTATITVSGTINDNTATVTVNGTTATVANGIFTASGITLTEGSNTITATATRGAETVTDTITVTYQPPVIPIAVHIESPANGVTTYDPAITVSGTVNENNATVTVNGVTATVENGQFTAANVPLTEGANTITATATYQGRTGIDSITVTYVNPLTLSITYPADGASLAMDQTIVRGTVTSVLTGFLVELNGVMAEIQGDQFVATKVSLTKGTNTITAKAVDSEGHTKTIEITVTTATAYHSPLELDTDITSGAAPLAITFYLKYSYPEVPGTMLSAAIDWEGDGTNDATPTTLSISHTYTQEGIYFPKLTMTDDLGNNYEAVTCINVYPMPPLEEMWNAMKAKLAAGDIEGALEYVHEGVRDKYRERFTSLSAQLGMMYSRSMTLHLESISSNVAEYELIVQLEDGTTYSFPLSFGRDSFGRWKITQL